MMTLYEIVVEIIGELPPSMTFLYSLMTCVLGLMLFSVCLAFILLPIVLIRK